jgi:ribose transport system permease protein
MSMPRGEHVSDHGTATSGVVATPTAKAEPPTRKSPLRALYPYAVLLTFALIFAFFASQRPDVFPTWDNTVAVLNASAITMLIAAGLTPALIVNDFDLSVASMASLASALVVVLTAQHHVATPTAILVVLLVALLVGVINGALVVVHSGSSFILTLAVASTLTGVEFLLTGQETVFVGVPRSLTDIGGTGVGGILTPVLLAGVVGVVLTLLIGTTVFGRQVRATGASARAAAIIGIRVRRVKVVCMCVSALMAALAGICISATTGNSYPSAGAPYLLPAFAAAFLGATLFASRRFTPLGSVVAALLLQGVSTGLVEMNYDSWTINAFNGLVLILAITAARVRVT